MYESKSRRSNITREKVEQKSCSFISPPKGSDFSEQKEYKSSNFSIKRKYIKKGGIMKNIQKIKEYQNLLEQNNIVLVDFYTTWCGPCKVYSPILDMVDKQIQEVQFAKVDIDILTDLADELNIVSVPTTVIYKNNEIVYQSAGVHQPQQILDILKQFI